MTLARLLPAGGLKRDLAGEGAAVGSGVFGELSFGEDGADVGFVEEVIGGRGEEKGGGVGFPGLGAHEGVNGGVATTANPAAELEAELGGEGKGSAVGDLEVL